MDRNTLLDTINRIVGEALESEDHLGMMSFGLHAAIKSFTRQGETSQTIYQTFRQVFENRVKGTSLEENFVKVMSE